MTATSRSAGAPALRPSRSRPHAWSATSDTLGATRGRSRRIRHACARARLPRHTAKATSGAPPRLAAWSSDIPRLAVRERFPRKGQKVGVRACDVKERPARRAGDDPGRVMRAQPQERGAPCGRVEREIRAQGDRVQPVERRQAPQPEVHSSGRHRPEERAAERGAPRREPRVPRRRAWTARASGTSATHASPPRFRGGTAAVSRPAETHAQPSRDQGTKAGSRRC